MNNPGEINPGESVLWSATVNGHYVRLVVQGAGSAWRCDCDEAVQPRADNPPSCEHIRFGFDVWFGRDTPENVIVSEVVGKPKRR